MQALRTSDYEQFKNRNPNRFEGTCQWVFQHERFQNWQLEATLKFPMDIRRSRMWQVSPVEITHRQRSQTVCFSHNMLLLLQG